MGRKLSSIVLCVLAAATVPVTVYIMHISGKPEFSVVPATGDSSKMWIWGIVSAVCIVAAIVLAIEIQEEKVRGIIRRRNPFSLACKSCTGKKLMICIGIFAV